MMSAMLHFAAQTLETVTVGAHARDFLRQSSLNSNKGMSLPLSIDFLEKLTTQSSLFSGLLGCARKEALLLLSNSVSSGTIPIKK